MLEEGIVRGSNGDGVVWGHTRKAVTAMPSPIARVDAILKCVVCGM